MSRNSRPTTRQSFRAVRARRGALVASRGPPSLRGIATIALSSVALLFTVVLPGSSQAATAIDLGTADGYAILGGAGVTNTGPSVVNGDLGTHPTPAVTGFGGPPNGTVNGVIHQGDAAALNAKNDLTTAFNNAAGQGPTTTVATDLGGLTLTPGVYDSITGDFGLTGALTLDAQGDPNAVFIFKSASTLITASASSVNMINGGQSCRVYWQLGSSATLGSGSRFVGTILAQQSISVNDAVTVDGRLLARSASVTLINDTVTRSQCAPATTPPPSNPTPPPTTPTPPGGGGPGGGGPGGSGPGGSPGGGGPGGGGSNPPLPPPRVHIVKTPFSTSTSTSRDACADRGFLAKFRIKSRGRMRSVKIFVDGELIKEKSSKRFSVWIKTRALRAGTHTIRIVAVDKRGQRDSSSRKFNRCGAAVPEPDFTGRAPAP